MVCRSQGERDRPPCTTMENGAEAYSRGLSCRLSYLATPGPGPCLSPSARREKRVTDDLSRLPCSSRPSPPLGTGAPHAGALEIEAACGEREGLISAARPLPFLLRPRGSGHGGLPRPSRHRHTQPQDCCRFWGVGNLASGTPPPN
ncbi:hypothetical protein NDU88_011853 [Pleurodeles waltl]|uniref:Uncharacterized protein n=1 Tax=Pleurodeles waltl TaxID=8319 RepID=A0AAV7S7H7_PLEWA|nr:hypothetical protein NDU88_011853 [Pleurodeles waltl]